MIDINIENIILDIFYNTNKWVRWIYLLLKRIPIRAPFDFSMYLSMCNIDM